MQKGPLGARLGAGCKNIHRPGLQRTGQIWGRYSTGSGPSGTSDRIERWHGSGESERRPTVAANSRGSRRELSAPSTVPTALPRRQGGSGERRGGTARLRARARERRRWAGCCSSRPSGWASTLATGFRWLVAVVSALARRTRSSARSPPSKRRAGGFGTPCPGKAGETSTRWRSPPRVWRWRSRRRPGPTRRHLARVHEQAVWLARHRRRWCRHGVLAVLCLVIRGNGRRADREPRAAPRPN